MITWTPSQVGLLEFNVDRASRGKLGPAGIVGVLCNFKGNIPLMISQSVGVKESNEAEVAVILEALLPLTLLLG